MYNISSTDNILTSSNSSSVSILWTILPIIFLIYFLIDIHYYARVVFTIAIGKHFRSKIKFTDPSEVYGIVLPSDADFLFIHMNNARYLREYDFARFDHASRSGCIDLMRKYGGGVAGHTIRYRLPVMMFSVFKIITRPLWWDEKFMYIDQRIVTVSDGITRSVGYSKVAFNFNIERFVKKQCPGLVKPEMPEDLKRWVDYLTRSSEMMKKI